MRALSSLALGVLAMALTVTGAANAAENGGAVYVVTYFEAAAPDVVKSRSRCQPVCRGEPQASRQCRVRGVSGNRPAEPVCNL